LLIPFPEIRSLTIHLRCSCTVAVAQATFLPTILKVFLKYSVTKSNIYAALTYIFMIPIYPFIGWHSDWTRDRMWHFIFCMVCCIPCYAVWMHTSTHPHLIGTTISVSSLYGMAFLGGMCRPAQPVLYSYRSLTLYGASEQAVGGAATVASLSIASIMGPQMYPNSDGPHYVPAFTASVCIIALGISAYLTLPLWLMWEANRRKAKTGFAVPLQAMEDEDNSEVSAATHDRLHEVSHVAEKQVDEVSLHEFADKKV
jgi:hypothetical protein